MALLVPIAFVLLGLRDFGRRRRSASTDGDACRMLFAGGFLGIVGVALLRQPSYVVVVVPVTAALSAGLLARKSTVGRACVVTLGILTTIAALVWLKGNPLFEVSRPVELSRSVEKTFARLIASPPDYEYLPPHVSYYAQRPIAGGHIRWRRGWRSDPAHEAQSLALLQHQSVPIAFSTADPVLETFKSYPRIHAYLEKYYAPVEGTKGFILVDTRRRPTGTFGPEKFPCFRSES
jgi:hypothetical protein